ncbi:MAG: hypothetical protein H0U71_04640 [Gammaproteobacteria bacterium]|nr:hypothetical protein [Gammaproteobacteria bacterium]
MQENNKETNTASADAQHNKVNDSTINILMRLQSDSSGGSNISLKRSREDDDQGNQQKIGPGVSDTSHGKILPVDQFLFEERILLKFLSEKDAQNYTMAFASDTAEQYGEYVYQKDEQSRDKFEIKPIVGEELINFRRVFQAHCINSIKQKLQTDCMKSIYRFNNNINNNNNNCSDNKNFTLMVTSSAKDAKQFGAFYKGAKLQVVSKFVVFEQGSLRGIPAAYEDAPILIEQKFNSDVRRKIALSKRGVEKSANSKQEIINEIIFKLSDKTISIVGNRREDFLILHCPDETKSFQERIKKHICTTIKMGDLLLLDVSEIPEELKNQLLATKESPDSEQLIANLAEEVFTFTRKTKHNPRSTAEMIMLAKKIENFFTIPEVAEEENNASLAL